MVCDPPNLPLAWTQKRRTRNKVDVVHTSKESRLTKQDEKLRLRRRLQDQAVDQAAKNRWEEAVETNLQLISLGEDADTLNRLGKAYFELGKLTDARESYQ